MVAQPAARPTLQHRGDEGEGLGLRHRAGGHGAVVARVELPPPPCTRAIRPLSRGPSSPARDSLFEAERPAGKCLLRPRPPPPALQDVVVPLVVGRAREGVNAAAQQDCPGRNPPRRVA